MFISNIQHSKDSTVVWFLGLWNKNNITLRYVDLWPLLYISVSREFEILNQPFHSVFQIVKALILLHPSILECLHNSFPAVLNCLEKVFVIYRVICWH